MQSRSPVKTARPETVWPQLVTATVAASAFVKLIAAMAMMLVAKAANRIRLVTQDFICSLSPDLARTSYGTYRSGDADARGNFPSSNVYAGVPLRRNSTPRGMGWLALAIAVACALVLGISEPVHWEPSRKPLAGTRGTQ